MSRRPSAAVMGLPSARPAQGLEFELNTRPAHATMTGGGGRAGWPRCAPGVSDTSGSSRRREAPTNSLRYRRGGRTWWRSANADASHFGCDTNGVSGAVPVRRATSRALRTRQQTSPDAGSAPAGLRPRLDFALDAQTPDEYRPGAVKTCSTEQPHPRRAVPVRLRRGAGNFQVQLRPGRPRRRRSARGARTAGGQQSELFTPNDGSRPDADVRRTAPTPTATGRRQRM